jgi:hypothetical protein
MAKVENASHARFIGAEEHPDVTYCKDPSVGPILSAALADLYEA